MKFIESLVLLILLSILACSSYLLYLVWPSGEVIEYQPYYYNVSDLQKDLNSSQFYPNMRYQKSIISYHIEDACTQERKNDIVQAFSMISNKSVLRFYPDPYKGQINILCSEIADKPQDLNAFIAGEGGPTKIVNTSNYYIILEGKVSLYRDKKCSEPTIVIHEILHALGFDHNSNPRSIMYPVASCDQKLDNHIFEEINRIYEQKPLPDLAIEKVDTIKSGRYLMFNIEISNRGIVDSDPAVLKVYADDNLIKEFDLNIIEIGTKKELEVQNLRIPSGSSYISFKIESLTNGKEISEDNNFVRMEI